MAQNSAAFFSHSFSGALNENQINQYKDYLDSNTTTFSGWLGEQAKIVSDNFNTFFTSKAWEFSKRFLKKNDGEYVSSFEIGYLGTISGIQNATGLMRNYIMAHEDVMALYVDKQISGYEGDFNAWCNGIGEDNLFWRQAMSGVLTTKKIDDVDYLAHSHYRDSVTGNLSFREKVDIHKTWNAVSHHLANKELFEIISDKKEETKPIE